MHALVGSLALLAEKISRSVSQHGVEGVLNKGVYYPIISHTENNIRWKPGLHLTYRVRSSNFKPQKKEHAHEESATGMQTLKIAGLRETNVHAHFLFSFLERSGKWKALRVDLPRVGRPGAEFGHILSSLAWTPFCWSHSETSGSRGRSWST